MGIKVRFDGLDVLAMVSHLNHVALGRRVINIYEGDTSDSFLFKLDHTGNNTINSGGTEEESKEKVMLYLESGIRFHTTNRQNANTAPAKNAPLAPFVFQLRKQLRGLRLEQVTQLGEGDRVVHLVFGMGAQRRSLLLELYAKGNLVLCDTNYSILALLRSHQYGGNGNKEAAVQVQVGHVYPVTYAARNVKKEQEERDTTGEINISGELTVTASSSAQEWATWTEYEVKQAAEKAKATEEAAALEQANSNNKNNTNKGKKMSKKDKQAGLVTLKTLLLKSTSGISHFGPNFLEHCILMNEMVPNTPLKLAGESNTSNSNLPSVKEWETFLQVFRQESAKLDKDPKALAAAPPKGYILYSDKRTTTTTDEPPKSTPGEDNTFVDKVLEEFQPYLLLKQHENRKVLEFDTFNEAVDTFFGHLEAQKRLLKAEAAEQAATDRLEKIRKDQELRLEGLGREVERVQEQAQVVEWNADSVEKALQVINSALDSGMDWEQLEQLIQVEQEENHNPIALLINQLDLENDSMVLELPNAEALAGVDDEEGDDSDAEEEEEEAPHQAKKKKRNGKGNQKQQPAAPVKKKKAKKNHVFVSISLKETAHGNASQLFARYRNMKEKSTRTVEASAKALKAAEETAQRQLAEAQQRTQQATNTAVSNVKPPWFTKFSWFITSDNYLVLGGRDAHQNEVLVKKYLRPGDAYLHADVHGAASCILRAKRIRIPGKKGKKATNKTLPLSDQALREAGNFTICRSSAWSSKMVTSAWWVESNQVSKTAPTGEYLKVGAFMIRGKKNFLPPTQLEMGLGVMFRLAAPEGTLDPATYARHKNERRDFALMELLQQQQEDLDVMDDEDDDVFVVSKPVIEEKKNLAEEETSDYVADTKEGPVEATSSLQDNELTGGEVDQLQASIASESETGCASPEEAVAEPEPETKPSQPPKNSKKKGLSVKERKLIKKYGSLEEAERVLAEREKEQQEKEKEKQMLAALAPVEDDEEDQYDAGNNGGSMKRGKRGKKKKAMKKYADQDDEDRELAMLALQGGEKIKKDKTKRTVEPTTEEQKQAAAETAALLVKDAAKFAEKLPEDIRAVLAECVTVQNKEDEEGVVRWDKFDADVLDQLMSFEGSEEAKLAAAKRLLFLKSTTRVDNFSASLAGILRTIKKFGHGNLETEASGQANDGPSRKTKEEKKADSAEWKKTLAEEGVVDNEAGGEDDEGDLDDTAENNKLTGKPLPEDVLLYALPVCAPYQTLTQYTYRIKLTPGNLKRGKAAKQCVDLFLKGDTGGNPGKKAPAAAGDATKDLIKRVADNDWIQSLCADVKISAAGASKANKKQKANNKAKAKKKK